MYNANTPTMEAPRKKKKGTKHVKAIFDDAGCTGFYEASPCVSIVSETNMMEPESRPSQEEAHLPTTNFQVLC